MCRTTSKLHKKYFDIEKKKKYKKNDFYYIIQNILKNKIISCFIPNFDICQLSQILFSRRFEFCDSQDVGVDNRVLKKFLILHVSLFVETNKKLPHFLCLQFLISLLDCGYYLQFIFLYFKYIFE